jgi:ABC-type multidrug transport system fused ATPase/permease subunit
VSFGYELENGAVQSPNGTSGAGTETDKAPAEPSSTNERKIPPAKERVLHGLSFSLASGTVLGLLGRTGSGKTTLCRLLFRLYDPDEGSICLGNTHAKGGTALDLRTLSLAELRCRVGMVTQDIQLFHASVRDNLTLFETSLPDERIERAICALGMGDWLASLPEGLNTELASGGSGLSAGEAQLLALARIFLQDPGLVILDEASSRLDPATEAMIEHAVGTLIQNRTAIIIAHRLSTVQRADEILILEKGRIREHGPRATLADDPNSRFHGLLQTGLEEVLA